MITALALILHANRVDTVGLRNAFRTAIGAVVTAIGSNPRIADAAHFTIDAGSFLTAAGIDNTADARAAWADVVGAGGAKASTQHLECTQQYDNCPLMRAISMERNGPDLVVTVDMMANRAGARGGAFVQEVTVTLH